MVQGELPVGGIHSFFGSDASVSGGLGWLVIRILISLGREIFLIQPG